MKKDYKAATRYARSFFLFAKEKNRLSETHEELQRILAFAHTHPEFSRLLLASTISNNEKEELIEHLLAGGSGSDEKRNIASLETRNFIKLLVKKNRFNLFEKMVESFGELFNTDRGIEEVTLVTPFAISGELERKLSRVLEIKLEKKVLLSTKLDPEMIGGAVVYTRGQVLDGSLKEKMRGLRQSLLSSPQGG